MVNVSIISKKIIKPLSPTPSTQRLHKLSLVDQVVSHSYIPLVFFYTKATIPNGPKQLSQLLANSLSKTLTCYYPWAGSLKDNATIDCDDHGAEFFEVQINSPMDKIVYHPDSRIKDLTFPQGTLWGSCIGRASTVAQLSHFECGGIALSVCVSHKVGDGCSAYYFLRDWAALTRNPNAKLAPFFVEDSLIPSPFDGPLVFPLVDSKPEEGIQKRFVFSASKISTLKALVAHESGVTNPTRNEVVNALLYKCAASANDNSGSFKPSQLIQCSNLRASMSPPLPPTSIGNILTVFSTPIYHEEQDLKLPKLVADIRKSKDNLSGRNNVEQNELVSEMLDAYRNGEAPYQQRSCDVYTNTSFLGFEFEKLDFGWGKPARGSIASGPANKIFILMNTPDRRGVEAFVNLNEQNMSAFENDKDLLQFATPIERAHNLL
ncbi:acyltransferase Pun1-like [Lycium ferocissimum]|uniref:acyltransferase Pun1-like n=1 Tax=Lycium ferocissimum TaxID=112874 RepID=UPI002814DB2D|nr:acyltransferase Pun1-like [Lycium ferocissimum]